MEESSGKRQANARRSRSREETEGDRLRGITARDAVSVDLVAAFAGDRPMTEAEQSLVSELQRSRGKQFFPDLLYAMTHQYFPPTAAEQLWNAILRHKRAMSKALNRNVQIIVAALDCLSNLDSTVHMPTLINEVQIAEIVNLSMRDGLTGLFNHTSFYEIIDLELRSCSRHGTVVSLIITDVDDFKSVNDRAGHQEGDRVLTEVAAAIRRGSRASDVCCRYGGDEFAVILPLTAAGEAAEVAERIRVETRLIRSGSHQLTLSAGVASSGENTTTARALVENADRALHQAKRDGRDRVVVA